jgi:hypothetical protein
VGPRAGLDSCGKSRPTGIRSPDRPARSESLYRLSYLCPYTYTYYLLIIPTCFDGHPQSSGSVNTNILKVKYNRNTIVLLILSYQGLAVETDLIK